MWEFYALDNCYAHTQNKCNCKLAIHMEDLAQELNNAAKAIQHKLT